MGIDRNVSFIVVTIDSSQSLSIGNIIHLLLYAQFMGVPKRASGIHMNQGNIITSAIIEES